MCNRYKSVRISQAGINIKAPSGRCDRPLGLEGIESEIDCDFQAVGKKVVSKELSDNAAKTHNNSNETIDSR